MPRKSDLLLEEKISTKRPTNGICTDKQGVILIDLDGKKWKLGKVLGIGGFGEIYEATNISVAEKNQYFVAKLEKHSKGPLFVEVNCYLRIAKSQMIEEWKESRNKSVLGMPHYVASGSHIYSGEKYRFLVIPRYKKDLEIVLKEKKTLSLKTVLTISLQILDVLEYIHDKGYVHSDIKASNIMLGNDTQPSVNNSYKEDYVNSNRNSTNIMLGHVAKPNVSNSYSIRLRSRIEKPKLRQLRSRTQVRKLRTLTRRTLRPVGNVKYIDDIPYLEEMLRVFEERKSTKKKISLTENNSEVTSSDHAYLLDFGLSSKYLLANGDHKPFCTDERKAHAGTILFCSRDAHKGVPTRRSDLESLGYNIIYWLTGELPWIEDLTKPEEIESKKDRCFKQLELFLQFCFHNEYPEFLLEYFRYLSKLQFHECPDYNLCRNIFRMGLKNYGYRDDSLMDFEDCNDWRNTLPKKSKKQKNVTIPTHSFLIKSPLKPLSSNVVFKRPKLRKKAKSVQIPDSIMNWSKILIDPENILKQARERKNTEDSEDFSEIDIEALNPTYAMISVYNKATGRDESWKCKSESYSHLNTIEGYTPAMMQIYLKMKKPKQIHYTLKFFSSIRNCSKSTRKWEETCTTPPVLRSSRILT